MSRATDVLNDLELAAKKLGMSIEEAVSVLLGKHPTHVVVQAHQTEAQKAVEEPTPAADPNAQAASQPAQTTAGTAAETAAADEPGTAA